jgi:hypothetical protein
VFARRAVQEAEVIAGHRYATIGSSAILLHQDSQENLESLDTICNYQAGLFFDVTPDFHKIYCCLRSKNIVHAHLGLAFQSRQMSIQLIFRNSFTTVELIDTGFNLCVDRIPVFQKPAILFFLALHQTEQDFLDAAGTGSLEQLLNPGLKGRVMDFNVHDLILQSLVKSILIVV